MEAEDTTTGPAPASFCVKGRGLPTREESRLDSYLSEEDGDVVFHYMCCESVWMWP